MNTFLKTGRMFMAFILLALSSCSSSTEERTKLSPEQIESKYSSGVVLIRNSYYYTISFNGIKPFYFTGVNENGEPENLTLDPDEISPAVIFGTGFFISKDGLIATNSHVASPAEDISSARTSLISAFRSLANDGTKEINEINEKLGVLRVAMISAESYTDRSEYEQLYEELAKERDSAQEAVNALNSLGSSDYEVTLHTDMGIAYNDTHVTNMSDFQDCVTVADDPSHDLAIIQLKDKNTPEGKHIFKLPKGKKTNSDEEADGSDSNTKKSGVKAGKKLYMIGFNLGPTLALTDQGVKAQVTSGEVSQNTDDSHIMYTIPALNGSSGSPVIDEYGKLIAINFASINTTQSFNFGVKASHLKKLLSNYKDE